MRPYLYLKPSNSRAEGKVTPVPKHHTMQAYRRYGSRFNMTF